MPVGFVASGANAGVASATTRVAGVPAGVVAGQTLLAYCATKNNEEHTWPAGWNKILQVNSGATMTASVAWKRAVGSDSAPTVTWTTAAACEGVCWSFSGAVAAPIGATTSNTGTTSPHTLTGLTTTAAGSAVVYIDAVDATGTALTADPNYAEHMDSGSAAATMRVAMGSQQRPTISAAPNMSMVGQAGNWVLIQIELLAAAPSGGFGRGPIQRCAARIATPNWRMRTWRKFS